MKSAGSVRRAFSKTRAAGLCHKEVSNALCDVIDRKEQTRRVTEVRRKEKKGGKVRKKI